MPIFKQNNELYTKTIRKIWLNIIKLKIIVCFLCLEYCNEGDLDEYLKKQPGKRVSE